MRFAVSLIILQVLNPNLQLASIPIVHQSIMTSSIFPVLMICLLTTCVFSIPNSCYKIIVHKCIFTNVLILHAVSNKFDVQMKLMNTTCCLKQIWCLVGINQRTHFYSLLFAVSFVRQSDR